MKVEEVCVLEERLEAQLFQLEVGGDAWRGSSLEIPEGDMRAAVEWGEMKLKQRICNERMLILNKESLHSTYSKPKQLFLCEFYIRKL